MTALLGIFYISTFIDLADKMFRGEATTSLVLRFFYFQTPQFVYYVIPIAVLVSTLVTIGVMTKNSELLVMRACGISLYRTSAPLVIFGLAASGMLYLAAGAGAGDGQPRSGPPEPDYPQPAAADFVARPALDRRHRRRDVPLRSVRREPEAASPGCGCTGWTPRPGASPRWTMRATRP